MNARDIAGTYFPPRSAKGVAARIVRDRTGVALRTETGSLPIDLDRISISSRIGSTPRRIEFPDDAMFETSDNDGVDKMFYGGQPNEPGVLLARLENVHGRLWLLVVIVAAFAVAVVWQGFPVVTNFAAAFISPEWEARLGRESMKTFDGFMLQPSELDGGKQDSVRNMFSELVLLSTATSEKPPPYEFELVFRKGGIIGPNAFAFPGGIVVVTDELIELAPSEDALAGVLAHEIGHVVGRHSIKQYAYNQGLSVVVFLMGGSDPSSFGVAADMTALLLEQGYSRDFEREADVHAVRLLRAAGRPPDALADMFEVLAKECEPHCDDLGWVSSHPGFAERIEAARARGAQPE